MKIFFWWWEYDCKMFSDWWKWSNLSPKLLCNVTMRYFLSSTSFFENCQKAHSQHIYFNDLNLPWDEFLWSEKLFHQKVWVLKNILNTHHIAISSIHQSYTIISIKLYLSSQLESDASYNLDFVIFQKTHKSVFSTFSFILS